MQNADACIHYLPAVVQQFDPHVVIQPMPNGTCVKLFESSSRVFRNLTSKPRGNTQAVLVPAAFSGEARDFYLGVVHAESQRAYQNYFYKMQVGVGVGGCTCVCAGRVLYGSLFAPPCQMTDACVATGGTDMWLDGLCRQCLLKHLLSTNSPCHEALLHLPISVSHPQRA
jgi:hypothetical protein